MHVICSPEQDLPCPLPSPDHLHVVCQTQHQYAVFTAPPLLWSTDITTCPNLPPPPPPEMYIPSSQPATCVPAALCVPWPCLPGQDKSLRTIRFWFFSCLYPLCPWHCVPVLATRFSAESFRSGHLALLHVPRLLCS